MLALRDRAAAPRFFLPSSARRFGNVLRAFEGCFIDSFQKRERDRRKRDKRQDKAERARERADLKKQRVVEAAQPAAQRADGSIESLTETTASEEGLAK